MENRTRRDFLAAAGAVVAVGAAGLAQGADAKPAKPPAGAEAAGPKKIIAVSCSPRKGATSAALRNALNAARQAQPQVQVELIELAGMSIPGEPAAGMPLPEGVKDDFPAVAAKLSDPAVRGIIIGTPVYFSSMSYLCKAFLDRWMVFRKDFALAHKVVGVLACGGTLHGGQETTIRSVQDCLFCHDMIVVGAGRPTSRFGAVVWAKEGDEASVVAAQSLGAHVAKVAMSISSK